MPASQCGMQQMLDNSTLFSAAVQPASQPARFAGDEQKAPNPNHGLGYKPEVQASGACILHHHAQPNPFNFHFETRGH